MKKIVCFIVLSGVLTASPLLAATRTWLSSSGGLWTNTLNWSEAMLPGANDIADLSAATGTLDLTEDVTVGEILYNPTPVGSTTNVLAILSDTVAPLSKTITLITTLTNHVQVGEGAELLLDADLMPTGNVRKDGQGTLVIKRRLPPTVKTDLYIEQGRVVNEGVIALFASRVHLGTLEPDAGLAPEFVMREGSSFYSTTVAQGTDLLVGGNRLLGSGTGSRAVVTHEGGVLDLTTNSIEGAFLNGYAAGGNSVYNLTGGEVDLRGKTTYIAFNGTGTVNQSGGRLKSGPLRFSKASTGIGTYNLAGGELWLSGIAQNGGGKAAFNIGGASIYPLGSGFNIYSDTKPSLTGVNGLTRFCSTGSGFTNSVSDMQGTGGFVKEGADTLNITGTAHSFSGPIIISNGTVNVNVVMTGRNKTLLAGGSLNLNDGASVNLGSLMVTGGVFQVSAESVFAIYGSDPWARVAGTGTARLLDGSTLLRLDVSESGVIDLSEGGTATVYRVRIDGVELAPGFYSSANCAKITGSGTLAVIMQWAGPALSDTFSRDDAAPAYDSPGQTEVGGADWAELTPYALGNTASITNGELRLGTGNSDPVIVLTAASWPNGIFSTRMRFKRIGASGGTVKNACGLLLRRNISARTGGASPDWDGAVHVQMTPAGGLFLRENYTVNKYLKNPFTGGDYITYGAAGSLPTSINGLPFDADGDGRLGDDEPFDLQAILSGSRLQVLINGEPVMASNGFAANSASEENCAGFWRNRLSSANFETHDSYHDDFAVTNLPYLIRHIGNFDPNVAAEWPRENWICTSGGSGCMTGTVTEVIGAEEHHAFSVNGGTSGYIHYHTPLSASEIADVNTNRWRFTMRLRVVGNNDSVDWGISGQVATAVRAFNLQFGSDASGNAKVRLLNAAGQGAAAHLIAGGSVYHTYTLEYNPKTSSVQLACDGAVLESGMTSGAYSQNRVFWGCGSTTHSGNANYELVQFEFLPPLPIPPPGTLLLMR